MKIAVEDLDLSSCHMAACLVHTCLRVALGLPPFNPALPVIQRRKAGNLEGKDLVGGTCKAAGPVRIGCVAELDGRDLGHARRPRIVGESLRIEWKRRVQAKDLEGEWLRASSQCLRLDHELQIAPLHTEVDSAELNNSCDLVDSLL